MDKRHLVQEAILHLRLIQQGQHLVDLYQKFFPKEFKKDRIDYSTDNSVLAAYCRFTALVHARLFPVCSYDEMDMLWEDPGSLLESIPLWCTSNTWLDRDEDQLSLLEKTIVSAAGFSEFQGVALRCPKTHCLDLDELVMRCVKGPMKRLPFAVEVVLCGTRNPFIDIDEELWCQAEMPDWHEENMRGLAKDWAEAKRIKRDYAKFEAWALARPERMQRIEWLLKASWVPKERPRVRTQVFTPTPLAEIPEIAEGNWEDE